MFPLTRKNRRSCRLDVYSQKDRLQKIGVVEPLEDRSLLAADLVAGTFFANGEDLVVQYVVEGGNIATPFEIELSLVSSDARVMAQSVTIDQAGDLSVGVHFKTIVPNWLEDASLDYEVEVQLDAGNVVGEPNEANNEATLSSGFFIMDEVLHVHGDDKANIVTIQNVGDSFQVRIDNLNATVSKDFISSIEVRTHAENDLIDLTPLGQPNGVTAIYTHGGSGDDTIDGSELNDFIWGGEGSDTISGHGGNDEIDAGPGNLDYAFGGVGNDTLEGNEGFDNLQGGPGDDTYVFAGVVDLGIDWITEVEDAGGVDTLDFSGVSHGVSVDLQQGSQSIGDDLQLVLYTSSDPNSSPSGDGFENIKGTNFDDTLIGNALNNRIWGYSGDDTMDGVGGDDVMLGMRGNDTLLGGGGADRLSGNLDDDTIEGGPGDDVTSGGRGDDVFVFTGTASLGFDRVSDVQGEDTLDFSGSGYGVGVNLTQSTPQKVNGHLTLQLLDPERFENINGSVFSDAFVGNDANNVFIGGKGLDALIGGGGDDSLHGGPDADIIDGGVGVDQIYGGAGNDRLIGGDEQYDADGRIRYDEIRGEEGHDIIEIGGGGHRVRGGSGDDTYVFVGHLPRFVELFEYVDGGGIDTLDFSNYGYPVRVHLDQVTAVTDRYDMIDSTFYSVIVNDEDGLPYEDVSLDSNAYENVKGTRFSDTLVGNDVNNIIWGNGGNDTILGNGGNDVLHGLGGDDKLFGHAGNDMLLGGDDDDELQGGPGDDLLDGGLGNDAFVYGCGSAHGTDTIRDASAPGSDIDTLDFYGFFYSCDRRDDDELPGINLRLSDTARQTVLSVLDLILEDELLIEWVLGTIFADDVVGNANDNLFIGGYRFDTFDGQGGNDIFIPGPQLN